MVRSTAFVTFSAPVKAPSTALKEPSAAHKAQEPSSQALSTAFGAPCKAVMALLLALKALKH